MDEPIYGKRAVMEALRANVPIQRVALVKDADSIEIDKISKLAKTLSIKVTPLPKGEFEKLIESKCRKGSEALSHQGVLAFARAFEYATLSAVREAVEGSSSGSEDALIVVLDHITDAGNLGAISRSAESVGATAMIIPKARSASVTHVTYKTSAGAIAHLPICKVANISRALEELKEDGFWVVGATEHADELLWDTDMTGRICLVLGSEHDGISANVIKKCDFLCKLPQSGKVSSLNVAQASTVFMYEWLRQNSGE